MKSKEQAYKNELCIKNTVHDSKNTKIEYFSPTAFQTSSKHQKNLFYRRSTRPASLTNFTNVLPQFKMTLQELVAVKPTAYWYPLNTSRRITFVQFVHPRLTKKKKKSLKISVFDQMNFRTIRCDLAWKIRA